MNRVTAHLTLYAVAGTLWLGASRLPRPAAPSAPPAFDYAETERRVSFLEAKETADPGAFGLSLLASAYLSRFSETGDETDLSRAENAARLSLNLRPNDSAKLSLAHSLIGQHQFAEAEKTVAGISGGEATLAECQLETGRYDAATHTLSLAQAARPTDPNLKALRARLFEIDGDVEHTLVTYKDALAGAQKIHSLPAPTCAWFHAQLGAALARARKPEEADAEFHQALEHFPGDWRTLTAQAKLRFSQQDWVGAQESAQASLKIVSTPEAAMIAADSAEKLGDSKETVRLRNLILESTTGAHQHGRSLALYLADHDLKPSEAVALAEAEAKTRPSIESYDALAWCLFKAGRKPEAEAAMRKALARGTRDPQLRHHAEQILGPNTLETQR